MSQNSGSHSHTWLSLVEISGLLVTEPVLEDHFSSGPPPVEPSVHRKVGRQHDRFLARADGEKARDALRTWSQFILHDVLNIPSQLWYRHPDVPAETICTLQEYRQQLKPNAAMLDEEEIPRLLVWECDPGQGLDDVEKETGRWRASPFHKFDRLLREVDVPVGILTNGHQWRLMYAMPGESTAHITWTAETWREEKHTLDAFHLLAGHDRFFGPEDDRLTALIEESQKRQTDVTDQLGEQVRDAVETFVRALDGADRAADGELLGDMSLPEIYEMSLTVMMRLVFLLYAEENHLLPHGEVTYDESYGLSHLAYRLAQEHQRNPDRFAHTYDAWDQLLAVFRLIHGGCSHPDFNQRAYGGRLFDPDRFAALEDERLRIPNDVVYSILRSLTFAEGKVGRRKIAQRVSYRTLSIEQIGYIYEGLIEYTAQRADETLVVFNSKEEPLIPLSDLEEARREGEEDLFEFLKSNSRRSKKQTEREFPKAVAEGALQIPLTGEDVAQDDVYAGLASYDYWIRREDTIFPHQLYVAQQQGPEGNVRKRTGTYYTPEWITSFMVERTLEPLVYEDVESRDLKSPREILDLKVCDPAMGSASFLVQVVRYMGERLVESWEQIRAEHPRRSLTLPYGEKADGTTGEMLMPEDREELYTHAKRFVADRCVYGVDINPLAVDLARMSLWLETLAKDRPFTFLNHRLKCGNSVIGAWDRDVEKYPDEAWERTNVPKPQKKILKRAQKVVKTQRKRYSGGQRRLFSYEGAVEEYLKDARRAMQGIENQPIYDVETKQERYERLQQNPLNRSLKRLFDGWCSIWFWPVDRHTDVPDLPLLEAYDEFQAALYRNENSTEHLNQLQQKWRRKVEDLSDEDDLNFFHWELEFPDVFSDARDGFDAIVGNPPYVKGGRLKRYKKWFDRQFSGLQQGQTDLFVYFYGRALNLIRSRGRISFISSNSYMKTDTGAGLRKALKRYTTIETFVDFGDLQVWRGVTNYPAVITCFNETPSDEHIIHAVDLSEKSAAENAKPGHVPAQLRDIAGQLEKSDLYVPQRQLSKNGWRMEDPRVEQLREKIMSQGVHLKEYCGSPLYGIKTGLNEAFIVDRKTRDALIEQDPKSEEVLQPLLEGKDLKPWRYESRDIWLICIPAGWTNRHRHEFGGDAEAWSFFAECYSGIANYLEAYEASAKARNDQGDFYWELRPCDYYESFADAKICFPGVTKTARFCLVNDFFYLNNPACFIPSNDLFLLAVLQSKVIWFVIDVTAQKVQSKYTRLYRKSVNPLPIVVPDRQTIQDLRELANKRVAVNQTQGKRLEERMNEIIYDIYGITPEERRIIESHWPIEEA